MLFSFTTKLSGWKSVHYPLPPSFLQGMLTISSFWSGQTNMSQNWPNIFHQNMPTYDLHMNWKTITRFLSWTWPSFGTQKSFLLQFIEKIHFLECIQTLDRSCQRHIRRVWFQLFCIARLWFVRRFSPYIRRLKTSRKFSRKMAIHLNWLTSAFSNFSTNSMKKKSLFTLFQKRSW